MRPGLVEDLRSGYLDDPYEAKRELARLSSLNEEAAETIIDQDKFINHLLVWMEAGQALIKELMKGNNK